MSNKNHIEPVKVEMPKRIGKKPTPKIETSLPKAPTTMPPDLYEQRKQESKQVKSDKPVFIASTPITFTPITKEMEKVLKKMFKEQEQKNKPVITKSTMFEKLLKSLAGKIIPMLLQWVFPYPVYKRENGDVVKDRKGKPVTDWPMTVLARVLSLITVLYGTVEILGLPLSEWIARVSGALGL